MLGVVEAALGALGRCYGRAKCFLQCISSPVVLAIFTPELLERSKYIAIMSPYGPYIVIQERHPKAAFMIKAPRKGCAARR